MIRVMRCFHILRVIVVRKCARGRGVKGHCIGGAVGAGFTTSCGEKWLSETVTSFSLEVLLAAILKGEVEGYISEPAILLSATKIAISTCPMDKI